MVTLLTLQNASPHLVVMLSTSDGFVRNTHTHANLPHHKNTLTPNRRWGLFVLSPAPVVGLSHSHDSDSCVPINDKCAVDWKEWHTNRWRAGERLFCGVCTNGNKRQDQQNLPLLFLQVPFFFFFLKRSNHSLLKQTKKPINIFLYNQLNGVHGKKLFCLKLLNFQA